MLECLRLEAIYVVVHGLLSALENQINMNFVDAIGSGRERDIERCTD